MGKHIEYSTEKELDQAIEKLLQDDPYGKVIAEHIKIAGCFVIRMDDDDQTLPGKGDPVALKKVPPEMQVLMRPKAHFVLVVDYHFWQTAPEEVRRGFLGQAISRIKVEKTEDGLKIGTRKFDVQTNISVIKQYGLFTENLSLMGEAVTSLSKKQLMMAQAIVERMRKPPEPKTEDDENDPPRVVARPIKKGKPAEDDESEEKTRPPRRIPPDPEPEPDSGAEPEPEE